MVAAIEIRGVKKAYKDVHALKGIDLEIPKGSFFGLLGPNGAGKTTLIHCICGLTEPTKGKIVVVGHDNKQEYRAARRAIGLSQQELQMDPFFSVHDLLVYQAGYFGIPADEAEKRTKKLLKRFGITSLAKRTPREISGGQKRRVELAKALIHGPEILILDEPTAGLDVETRQELWEQIRGLNDDGLTVLLTTHYIEEAQELCDTVAIINDGTILHVEKKTALLDRFARKTITATYAKKPKAVKGATREDKTLTVQIEPGQDESAVIKELQNAGELVGIDTRRQSLEEVFLRLTRKKR